MCQMSTAGEPTDMHMAITQTLWFTNMPASSASVCILKILLLRAAIPTYNGIKWMGVVSCVLSVLCIPPLYFPMWGGMFMPAKTGVTEEDYYYNEYSDVEREQGLHLASSAFVSSSPRFATSMLSMAMVHVQCCPTTAYFKHLMQCITLKWQSYMHAVSVAYMLSVYCTLTFSHI